MIEVVTQQRVDRWLVKTARHAATPVNPRRRR
jgi:hypothetical protein